MAAVAEKEGIRGQVHERYAAAARAPTENRCGGCCVASGRGALLRVRGS